MSKLIEVMMGSVEPTLREAPATFHAIGEGLWQVERQLAFPFGMHLPLRMTVMRVGEGLVLHSPIELSDDEWCRVDALGRVTSVIAPNSFHHVFVRPCIERYPDADLYVPPALPERVPSLPPATELTAVPPDGWNDSMDQAVIGGGEPFYGEVVFFHRPSRTLVLTDLAFNGPPSGASRWQQLGWRLFGVGPDFGPSRNIRMTLFRRVESLADQLAPLRDWDFRCITVTHGPAVQNDAYRAFHTAFARYL